MSPQDSAVIDQYLNGLKSFLRADDFLGKTNLGNLIDECGAAALKLCGPHEHYMTYASGAAVITNKQLEAAPDQESRRLIPATMYN